MIEKTEAVCLRVAPFGGTSHIVSWLTTDFGRVTTAMKGACRPKSPFLGQYDLYYTCELLFYRRERDGIHLARECAPLQLRDPLRTNWRAAAVASYLCDLQLHMSGDGSDAGAMFATLTRALDALCNGAPPLPVMLWSEARLLCIEGWTPRLDRCASCDPAEPPSRFSLADGRMVCEHAPSYSSRDETVGLPESVVALLSAWSAASAPLPDIASLNAICRKTLLGLQRFLGMFVPYHLERTRVARAKALELLNYPAAAQKL